jgi:hypothetical protein
MKIAYIRGRSLVESTNIRTGIVYSLLTCLFQYIAVILVKVKLKQSNYRP